MGRWQIIHTTSSTWPWYYRVCLGVLYGLNWIVLNPRQTLNSLSTMRKSLHTLLVPVSTMDLSSVLRANVYVRCFRGTTQFQLQNWNSLLWWNQNAASEIISSWHPSSLQHGTQRSQTKAWRFLKPPVQLHLSWLRSQFFVIYFMWNRTALTFLLCVYSSCFFFFGPAVVWNWKWPCTSCLAERKLNIIQVEEEKNPTGSR